MRPVPATWSAAGLVAVIAAAGFLDGLERQSTEGAVRDLSEKPSFEEKQCIKYVLLLEPRSTIKESLSFMEKENSGTVKVIIESTAGAEKVVICEYARGQVMDVYSAK